MTAAERLAVIGWLKKLDGEFSKRNFSMTSAGAVASRNLKVPEVIGIMAANVGGKIYRTDLGYGVRRSALPNAALVGNKSLVLVISLREIRKGETIAVELP